VEARFPRRDVAGGAARATAVHGRWPTVAGWAVMLTVAVLLSSMLLVQVAEAQSAGACPGAAVGQASSGLATTAGTVAGGAAKPNGGLATTAGTIAGGAAKPNSGLATAAGAVAGGTAKPNGGLATTAGTIAGGTAKPNGGLGADGEAVGSACQGVAGQAWSIRKVAAQSDSSQGASTSSSKIWEGLVELVRAIVGEGIG
jgi:hypothetical protein